MDRDRARSVATVAFIVGLAAGGGAGAYWAWWNGKSQPFNPDLVPPMWPWVALAAVAAVSVLVAVALELAVFLTPER